MKALIVSDPMDREVNVDHFYEYLVQHQRKVEYKYLKSNLIFDVDLSSFDVVIEGASTSVLSKGYVDIPKGTKFVKHVLDQMWAEIRFMEWFKGHAPYDLIITNGAPSMYNPHITTRHHVLPLDPEVYEVGHGERVFDVIHQCSVEPRYAFHANRKKALDILKSDPTLRVFRSEEKLSHPTYVDAIQSSKMMFVETSMRGYLIQKMFEAPLCGAVMIGEPPYGYDNLFEDSVTYIDCKPPFKDLLTLVNYYKEQPDTLDQMSMYMRIRINAYYSISQQADRFSKILMEALL